MDVRSGQRCAIGFLMAAMCANARAVGPNAIWHPMPGFMDKAHAACDRQAFPKFGDCFLEQMKKSGAPEEAVEFAELTGNTGYMTAYRNTGAVDIAYIQYPFRANENYGWLFVNGAPATVNPDDIDRLPMDRLKTDRAYQQTLRDHPKASLWPGLRDVPDQPAAVALADGTQEFIVPYNVQDGCHACAVIGRAFFAFQFGPSGKFNGALFEGYAAGDGASMPPTPIRVILNQSFTLSLASNRTTGYSWQIDSAPDSSIVRSNGTEYREAATGLAGAGGEELWKFNAVGPGETTFTLKYVRAWMRRTPAGEAAPARTLSFEVISSR